MNQTLIEEIEAHIMHLEQGKEIAVKAHKIFLNEMNGWIADLKKRVKREKSKK